MSWVLAPPEREGGGGREEGGRNRLSEGERKEAGRGRGERQTVSECIVENLDLYLQML